MTVTLLALRFFFYDCNANTIEICNDAECTDCSTLGGYINWLCWSSVPITTEDTNPTENTQNTAATDETGDTSGEDDTSMASYLLPVIASSLPLLI